MNLPQFRPAMPSFGRALPAFGRHEFHPSTVLHREIACVALIAEASASDEVVDAGGSLEVLDPTGHFEVRWGRKKTEVEIAEATFKDLLSKGYLAFKKTWTGRKGRRMESFDSEAGVAIFDKEVEAKKLPVRDPVAEAKAAEEKAKRDADEKARKDAEEKKMERIRVAKGDRHKAVEAARSAKQNHEEATRSLREARDREGAAERKVVESNAKAEAAGNRREETLKALETAQSGGDAPLADGSVTPNLAALRQQYDEAVAAEAGSKKAHEEARLEATAASSASVDASAAETVAHDKKLKADKAAGAAESEHDDAMTDLHGEPEHEQTKEFDKDAKTTMTPPMRGG